MTRKTEKGEARYLTSGDGRKDFDTDVLDELEETEEQVNWW
jgi:hypothetical protein